MNPLAQKLLILGGVLIFASYGIIFLFAFVYGFCLPLLTGFKDSVGTEMAWIYPIGICSLIFKIAGFVFLASGLIRYFGSLLFRKSISK